jgi:ABC-2 type transport system permease protein
MLDSPNVPWIFATLVRLTPLQYLAYFPSAVFLEKITGWALVQGLCIQAGWVLACIAACRLMFHFGVKRYSGFGG